MPTQIEGRDSVELRSDFGEGQKGDAKRWGLEVQLAEKEYKRWMDKGEKISKRYRDITELENRVIERTATSYNILWSNVQTLLPALYSQTPKTQVDRRFKDKDPLGRVSAQILERATDYCVKEEEFDDVMMQCCLDYLLVGRGTAWVRYVPHIEQRKEVVLPDQRQAMHETEDELFEEGGEVYRMFEEVTYEQALTDYVHWKDFLHSPARVWEEVRWVARKVYMTRDQLVGRWGEELGNQIPLDYEVHAAKRIVEEEEGFIQEAFKKAQIYEIWSKEDKKVYWYSDAGGRIIEEKPDPLGLSGFFPCPKPLYATLTNDNLIPVPDYVMYQDQATELDDLTARIDLLTNASRIMGVYDANFEELQRIMDESAENELIPVKDWPGFVQAGGFQGVMQTFPLGEIVSALQTLVQMREQIKADMYELTGLSDIIRGYSAPVETATAAQLKGQFASLRIQPRQHEVQRLARDIVALKAEIIAEHFSPETIALMAGTEMMTQDVQGTFVQAVQLLRNDAMRTFRVTIETDSTIAIDTDMEKAQRTEVVQVIGQFLQQSMQVGMVMPQLAPMLGELLLWLMRGYKTGRNLEGSIEQAIEMAQQSQQQPQPEQPDPELLKLQTDTQLKQAELQAEIQQAAAKLQQDAVIKQQELESKNQIEMQKIAQRQEEMSAKMQVDLQKLRQELQVDMQKIQNDFFIKQLEVQHKKEMAEKPSEVKRAVFSTNPETGDREAIIGTVNGR